MADRSTTAHATAARRLIVPHYLGVSSIQQQTLSAGGWYSVAAKCLRMENHDEALKLHPQRTIRDYRKSLILDNFKKLRTHTKKKKKTAGRVELEVNIQG